MDKYFKVSTLNATPNPQKLVYLAMHQDYSEHMVSEEGEDLGCTEETYGKRIIKHLLANKRGHFGCFEHPQINLNLGYFPHSVMQQLRTHRIGVYFDNIDKRIEGTFDVQSTRYTGQRIIEFVENAGNQDIEEIFYFRPVGFYTDRKGNKYEYTEEDRSEDITDAYYAANKYAILVKRGWSEEHARLSCLGYNIRQHFVMSINARALMHICDLRAKKDAEIEIQQLSLLLLAEFYKWMPQVAEWYERERLGKALLSP